MPAHPPARPSARLVWTRYGKAQTRLLRVTRQGQRHEITDLNVSVALEGDFQAAYEAGDNSGVLPTDSQKNAVWALANQGVGEIEDFALRLARHFSAAHPSIARVRVTVEEYRWERIDVEGEPHPHAFRRPGGEIRRAEASCEEGREWVVSGIDGLTVLKSSGSEFQGFLHDRYTTLEDAFDRILATDVRARWLHAAGPADWTSSFGAVRRALLETFATFYSHSLQETLFAMGRAILDGVPGIDEVRLKMPNRHHFEVDLAAFGEQNEGLFFPADRPYGMIEGAVERPGTSPSRAVRPAWIWEEA
ncbi:MAG: factor-independent urate hydroxylase [Candidatus Dormibacteraceae bacterium]